MTPIGSCLAIKLPCEEYTWDEVSIAAWSTPTTVLDVLTASARLQSFDEYKFQNPDKA